MQGASPLASPRLNPGGTGGTCEAGTQRGVCFPCRPPNLPPLSPEGGGGGGCRLSLPLVYFSAPIPPPPFPAGRGRIIVFLCKGLRPLHPQHLTACGTYRLCRFGARRGGMPGWSPADLSFRLLFCPHPPVPLPGGKGENQGYFMQGASPLASPALNRLRHLQTLTFRYPGASLPWNRARACVHENNREKFLGVWGLLSRSPQRFPVL